MDKLIAKLASKITDLGKDNIPAIRQKRVNEALSLVAEIIPKIEDYVQDEAKREVDVLEKKV